MVNQAGRFEEYKGVMYLLEAFKLLRDKYRHQDIGLLLIGSGSLEQQIRSWVVNNQLENWIKIENSLETSGFHHNAFGGFLGLRIGLCSIGEGDVTFKNFNYKPMK